MPEATLLGRDADLATLDALLDAAASGCGALAVVSGEAGLGKSALLDEALSRAAARGFSIVEGRAWEFADAPPLFPLSAALRSVGIDVAEARAGGDQGAFLLWERVLEALAAVSEEAPVLWSVEDLHAADLQSIDVLTFLARPLRALRAVVLVTLRLEDARLDERARERLTRMKRDGAHLALEPLAPAEVVALARRSAGFEIPADVVNQLADLAGGNPLFVVEYARALAAARGHPGALATPPPTVRKLTLERTRWLPDATQRALEAAAVIGREFSGAVTGRVLGLLAARAIEGVLPALRSGLVIETAPGQFRFRHALIRDAIYEAIPPTERAALHARVAEALQSGTDSTDARMTRAHHALLALPSLDARVVTDLVEQSEALLEAQGAHDRAFTLRLRADAARRDGLLPPASSEHMLDSARLAQTAGRFAQSRRLCEELLARGRSGADPVLIARTALVLGSSLRPAVVDPVLTGALREADAGLDQSEARLHCLVRARLAAALQPAPEPEEPMGMARRAIETARTFGDAELLRDVLFFAGSALTDYAPADERLVCAEELLALAERSFDHPRTLTACARLGMDRLLNGDFDAFSALVDRALHVCDALGRAPRHRWRPLLTASMRAATLGQFAESERLTVEARELGSHCDDPALTVSGWMHRLCVQRLQRLDDVVAGQMDDLQQQTAAMGDSGIGHVLRAMMLSRAEDVAGTARALWQAIPHRARVSNEPDAAFMLAEATALAGSEAERRRVYHELLARPGVDAVMGHIFIMYDGPVSRLSGLLAASLGDLATAEKDLRRALTVAKQRYHSPWVAQIEYELGKTLAAVGRLDDARACFVAAAEGAAALSMPGLLDAAQRRIGEQPAPKATTSGLALEREGEVWLLRHGEHSIRVRDSRGMHLLARLVERAGEEIHVLALVSEGRTAESDAGEHLDDLARDRYRARLRELESEIDAAESGADLGRLDRLRTERDVLVLELSRAFGLGGKARRAGSATERARVNVRKRLKQAIEQVAAADTALGTYLERALRTGAFCSFRP